MRTLVAIAVAVAVIIAAPAWAGVVLKFKRDYAAILPLDLCIMTRPEWDALPASEKLKCPEYVFQHAWSGKIFKRRFLSPKGRLSVLDGMRRGLARILNWKPPTY